MTDSANITVTNHRLRKAMSQVNDDDLKSHSKKVGEKLRSELELKIGEITKIYPYKDKCEVKIAETNQKTTCLIAHDILSEGMNVSGFPKGKTTHEKADEVIIPLETIYGIILDVNTGKKKQKCVVSYVNLDRPHTKNNARSGEYKIQVGDNKISVTDKYININSSNLFVNGLPYDSPELQNYYSKTTIDNIQEDNDNQLTELYEKIDEIDIESVIALLEDFKNNFAVKVNSLPTASQDTLGKIYLVKTNNNYDEYLTIQDNDAYVWEKIGSTSGGSGGTVTWEDITGKPSTFTPSNHNHGALNNNGTIDSNTLIIKNIAVTDSNNNLKTVNKIPYSKISETPNIPSKISDLENDGSFIETSSTNGLVRNDGTIDTTNYLSSLPSHTHDDRYYTESETDSLLNDKQDTLVNQVNIKSINGQSLLGSGNITIEGGSGGGGSTIQGYYWDDETKEMVLEYTNGIVDIIYPVGSIYMSVNSANPSTLFGGEWVQIKDTFLLACGDTYSSDGDVATAQHGEANHTLTVNEMPSHTHTQNAHNHKAFDSNYLSETSSGISFTTKRAMDYSTGNYKYAYIGANDTVSNHTVTANATATNQNTGGGASHNNMPPYMSVYVWKRIA